MFYFFDFKTKTIHFAQISEIHGNTHLKNNEWVFHKCAFILVTVYFLFCFYLSYVPSFDLDFIKNSSITGCFGELSGCFCQYSNDSCNL